MASIEDIKKLLESKSFTSARDLDELEEKPDDKQNHDPTDHRCDTDHFSILLHKSFFVIDDLCIIR